jgi:hypothetical protein
VLKRGLDGEDHRNLREAEILLNKRHMISEHEKKLYLLDWKTQAQRQGWRLLRSKLNSSMMTYCRIRAHSRRNYDPAGGIHNYLKPLSPLKILNIYRAAT